MKTWHWLALAPVVLVFACVGIGALMFLRVERSSRNSLEDYSTRVLATLAPAMSLERCYGNSTVRVAACSARGTKAEVSSFVAALKATPPARGPAKYESDEACGALAGFHATGGDLVPGTTLLQPSATLPPNNHNLVLQYVYVDSTGERVCLGFKYPYG